MLRATTLDDRGTRVPLVPYRLRAVLASDEQSVRLRSRRYGASSGAGVVKGIVLGVMGLVFITAAAMAPAYLAFHLGLPAWAKVCAMIPTLIGPGVVTFILVRRHSAHVIARAHASAGLCGSCGYDLCATSPEPDGCSVCPECGAAWRCE